MYSHPASVEYAAQYHQDELLREARNARLAREATGTDTHSTPHHAVVAAAVAVLMVLAVFVLI